MCVCVCVCVCECMCVCVCVALSTPLFFILFFFNACFVFLSFDGSETFAKVNINRDYLCIWLTGFPHGYCGFPIYPLGCLKPEAFFLFQGQRPPPLIHIPKLSTLSLFPLPSPTFLSLCHSSLPFEFDIIYLLHHTHYTSLSCHHFSMHRSKDKWISSPFHFS